jgi:hypothetical protein
MIPWIVSLKPNANSRMMDIIVEMRFGSHLYGTATPQSDLDYKAVYLPNARDILLQRVQSTATRSDDKSAGERNVPGNVDYEVHSLQRYLELLTQGQTMALDMLFAPESAMTRPPTPLWLEIQANASRLVTKRASVFLRYCQQQANKYGIKGSRASAARQINAVLAEAEARYGSSAKLAAAETELEAAAGVSGHAGVIELPTPRGGFVRHFEVCGKKMPFTSSIKSAREIAQHLVGEYGQRTLQAERNEGIDWKALSHAVRVGREALELFTTGRITFPLPYAAEILEIKLGRLNYERVAETIEQLLIDVEAAASASLLREVPDAEFIDDLVAKSYRSQVVRT